ncbi:MAG: GerMN domain-containing protein [Bacillaceae bacterium]|nr:GerMN domain-containing protein [Bacillaceae bacterium]
MRNIFRAGVPIVVALTLVVSGCSLGEEQTMKEMDSPPITFIDLETSLEVNPEEGAEEVENQTESTEIIMRELYLIDQNGLVASQTLPLPKVEGTARQVLEYLVQDGPISQIVPNGFQAVLPPGTEVLGVNIKDGVAIADFSEQFKDYRPEDELKILQAITWTLTQFDTVDTIKIRINGYDQELMPNNGTPIGEGFSRANGINIETDQVADISNTRGVTLYFLGQSGANPYYVPVTRRINSSDNDLEAIVTQLLKGPSSFTNLQTDFRTGVKLLETPKYANGVVTVNFNEALLNHIDGTAISEEVLNSLVLSLTEHQGVERVAIQVNGDGKLLMASGEFLSEPVSRPMQVNTMKY